MAPRRRAHWLHLPLLGGLFLLSACPGGDDPAPTPSSDPNQGDPDADGVRELHGLRVTVGTPGQESEHSGYLRVIRDGELMEPGKQWTRVRAGVIEVAVPPGEAQRVPMVADMVALQQITIEEQVLLTHVPPGGQLRLVDHPCHGWGFSSRWLDADRVEPPLAVCVEQGASCPAGFVPATPGLAMDPMCLSAGLPEGLRCVAEGQLEVRGEPGTPLLVEQPGQEPQRLEFQDPDTPLTLPLFPGGCQSTVIGYGDQRYQLLVGSGQRFALKFRDGALLGANLALEEEEEEDPAALTGQEQP